LAKACSAETGAVPENDESFPFNAPAWIIAGNAWQEWDFSCDSALVYARKLQLYSMAMRNLSPSLKIGALGKWVLTDDTRDEIFNEISNSSIRRMISLTCFSGTLPLLENGCLLNHGMYIHGRRSVIRSQR